MIGHPIDPTHGEYLREVFLRANKRAWCYFSPFLCAFSLAPNRIVCLDEFAGSTCLFVQRPNGIDLLLPPLPCDADALERVLDTLADHQKGRVPRILWMDACDAQHVNTERFELREKDAEYIYDPSQIALTKGRGFRDVRKRVRRFERAHRFHFRPLNSSDMPHCIALLKYWRRRQGRRYPFLLDWGYTLAALGQFHCWSEDMLRGWCVEIAGRIEAFALAGDIQPDLAHFFVAKANPDVPDLSYFLRWQIYGELSAYRRVNDAGDLGLSGLRQFKQKFRPVDRWRVFFAEPLRGTS